MTENIEKNENNQSVETEQLSFVDEKVRFKLDNFEGPLDLLLHLIKDAKLIKALYDESCISKWCE